MKLLNRMKKHAALVLAVAMVLGMQVTTMASDYSEHWAKDVITEWTNYGVTAGYEDGTFKPNNSMTRAEFATVLTNVFGLTSKDAAQTFTDVKEGAWYQEAVTLASSAGIMNGAGGKFNPNAKITRQEAAVALVNAYSLSGKGDGSVNFTDAANIAAWAKEQVEALASFGYISGRPDGSFDPAGNITRAEVMAMLDNLTVGLMNKAGTYTEDQNGNVVVNVQDVVLKNMTITGNLYLAQGIGLGDATLENVTVEGEIIVAGGGVNSIHFKNVTAKKPVKVTAKAPVRLVAEGKKIAVVAEKGTDLVLTGEFSEVILPAGVTLELKEAKVDKVTAADETVKVTIGKGSAITEIIGGDVTNNNKPSGGGGGGGGGSTVTPSEKKYIEVESILVDGVELMNNGISMSKNEITVDVNALISAYEAAGETEITTGTVKFANLNAGDKVTVSRKLINPIGLVERTREVGTNGTMTYSVAQAADKFNENRDRIIAKLEQAKMKEDVEAVLAELGLSLTGDYLADDSISVATARAKFEALKALYADRANNKAVQNLVKYASEIYDGATGLVFTDSTVTGKVTVQAGSLESAEYTVTIKF